MIKINLSKAKEISHNIRRAKREEEFKPLDDIISKKIPANNLDEVELERQKIRDKYEDIQNKIDSAKSPEELKKILGLS